MDRSEQGTDDQASRDMLRECRDLISRRVRRSLSAMVRDAHEKLSDRAVSEGGDVAGSRYFDVIREIQPRRYELALRFENCFADVVDRAIRRELVPAPGTADPTTSDPILVQAAERVARQCRDGLRMLDQRLEMIMGDAWAGQHRNPFTPGHVFEAFDAVCRDVDCGDDVRRLLLQLFENRLGEELPAAYGELNSVLAHGENARENRGRRVPSSEPVRQCLRRQIARRRIPHFIEDFLFENWVRWMERIYQEKGEGSPEWKRALETAEDLIAGVQDIADVNRRREAIWGLPSLIHRLRRGMREIPMDLHEQMVFLKTLRTYHLALIGKKVGEG